MSTDETNNDRVFKLLGYAADRGLSATESRELRALLVDDADARDQYAAYMLLHADLAWERKTDAQRETPHVKATQPTSAFTSSLRRLPKLSDAGRWRDEARMRGETPALPRDSIRRVCEMERRGPLLVRARPDAWALSSM